MRNSPQLRGARPLFTIKRISLGGVLVLTLLSIQAANAVTVDWTGTVANSCVVTVGSNGVLGLSLDGKSLSSDQATGMPAMVTVASTTTNVVTFSQATLALRATGYLGTPAMFTKESSNKGHLRDWQPTSYQETIQSGDTVFNFHAKAQDENTFPMGIYRMSSEVTCAPPN
jgi:hypothetical protein